MTIVCHPLTYLAFSYLFIGWSCLFCSLWSLWGLEQFLAYSRYCDYLLNEYYLETALLFEGLVNLGF